MIRIWRSISIISVFLIALLGEVSSAQPALHLKPALRDMEKACLKNQSEPRIKKWPGSCFCISNSFFREMGEEPRASAIEQIQWTSKVFDETLSEEQFELDPLNLVEMLDDTLNRCAEPKKAEK